MGAKKSVVFKECPFGYGFRLIADQNRTHLFQFLLKIHTNGCYKEGGDFHPLSNHFPPTLG